MRKNVVKEEFEKLMRDIQKYPILSPEKERELFSQYHSGSMDARQQIINCSLRLVASNAMHFTTNYDELFVLFQEGVLGVMIAINKFDISKGVKFSTYATYWIRQTMYRSIIKNATSNTVPEWMNQLAKKVQEYSDKYYRIHGERPTNELMADVLGVSVKNINIAQNIFKKPYSIDYTSEEDEEFIDIADHIDVEEEAIKNIMREDLLEYLNVILDEKEKNIIIDRYGLIDNCCLSVRQIAHKMNLETNKVAVLEISSLRKLRKSGVRALRDYL